MADRYPAHQFRNYICEIALCFETASFSFSVNILEMVFSLLRLHPTDDTPESNRAVLVHPIGRAELPRTRPVPERPGSYQSLPVNAGIYKDEIFRVLAFVRFHSSRTANCSA